MEVDLIFHFPFSTIRYTLSVMLEKELETAIKLAREASVAILEIYKTAFAVEKKSVNLYYSEPVTIADKTSSKIIVEGLAGVFSDDAILSEEEPDDIERRMTRSRVWIIDPLDGTKGFVERKDDFAVQIGLAEKGNPMLGVVYYPVKDILYYAVKDSGSFMVENGGKAKRLQVSEITDFSEMTIAVSRSHRSQKMTRLNEHFGFKDEFRHGSVGLKVGFLARQIADIYIHLSPHTKFWDTAAPQIILEEAGGQLTDIFGEKIRYDLADVRNHNGIFSTNGLSHKKAVSHLKPLLTEFGRLRVKAVK
jgi:3'(2'), 5'-bisphosphate nucleotidase